MMTGSIKVTKESPDGASNIYFFSDNTLLDNSPLTLTHVCLKVHGGVLIEVGNFSPC